MRSRRELGGLIGNVRQYGNAISSGIFQPQHKCRGGVSGSFTEPTSSRASGGWRIDEAAMHLGEADWPRVGVYIGPQTGGVIRTDWRFPSITFGFNLVNGLNFDTTKISLMWQYSSLLPNWVNISDRTSNYISVGYTQDFDGGLFRIQATAGLRVFYSPVYDLRVTHETESFYWVVQPTSVQGESGTLVELFARAAWSGDPDMVIEYYWQKNIAGSWFFVNDSASGGTGLNGTSLEVYVTDGPTLAEDITVGTYRAVAVANGQTIYSNSASVSVAPTGPGPSVPG